MQAQWTSTVTAVLVGFSAVGVTASTAWFVFEYYPIWSVFLGVKAGPDDNGCGGRPDPPFYMKVWLLASTPFSKLYDAVTSTCGTLKERLIGVIRMNTSRGNPDDLEASASDEKSTGESITSSEKDQVPVVEPSSKSMSQPGRPMDLRSAANSAKLLQRWRSIATSTTPIHSLTRALKCVKPKVVENFGSPILAMSFARDAKSGLMAVSR